MIKHASNFVMGGLFLLGISLTACSGENGADGRDADPVNIDSLATAIRNEISDNLRDTPPPSAKTQPEHSGTPSTQNLT